MGLKKIVIFKKERVIGITGEQKEKESNEQVLKIFNSGYNDTQERRKQQNRVCFFSVNLNPVKDSGSLDRSLGFCCVRCAGLKKCNIEKCGSELMYMLAKWEKKIFADNFYDRRMYMRTSCRKPAYLKEKIGCIRKFFKILQFASFWSWKDTKIFNILNRRK